MPLQKFIAREPLLGTDQRVFGHELVLQPDSGAPPGEDDSLSLLQILGSCWNHPESGWAAGDQLTFLRADAGLLLSFGMHHLRPESTVLITEMAELIDEGQQSVLQALRDRGFRILLRYDGALAQHPPLLALADYIELQADHPDFERQVRALKSTLPSAVRLIVRGLTSWQDYENCTRQGLDAFAGGLYLAPRPGTSLRGMDPAQQTILQLMNLTRQQADVRELESVLKRDVTISFKLLRYINSVGFGLGTGISSVRHAIALLGYSTLFKWLSLLLATAKPVQYGAVLFQTALVRGRLTELLGRHLLQRSEQEDLFVVGMFSVLDRILGAPMEQVLEKIQLSDAASQALLAREGLYGPFLSLAEAMEGRQSENALDLTERLFLQPGQVNEAHLSALAWAQSLQL